MLPKIPWSQSTLMFACMCRRDWLYTGDVRCEDLLVVKIKYSDICPCNEANRY
jgi:hypothetical protein